MASFIKSILSILVLKLKNIPVSFSNRISKSLFGKRVSVGSDNIISNVHLGDDVRIFNSNKVQDSLLKGNNRLGDRNIISDVTLGHFSYVGTNCQISNTEIGRFCSIGNNVQIVPGSHPIKFLSTHPAFYSTFNNVSLNFCDRNYFEEIHRIEIGNDVWIGNSVTVVDGVKINDGAIVAAGSVVTKDIPSYAVVGGIPAKILKYRFNENIIEQLLKIKWWEWPVEKIHEKSSFFQTDNEEEIINFITLHK